MFPGFQQPSEGCLVKRLGPPLMRKPLVTALPVFIKRIAKSLREIVEKLGTAVSHALGQRGPAVSHLRRTAKWGRVSLLGRAGSRLLMRLRHTVPMHGAQQEFRLGVASWSEALLLR